MTKSEAIIEIKKILNELSIPDAGKAIWECHYYIIDQENAILRDTKLNTAGEPLDTANVKDAEDEEYLEKAKQKSIKADRFSNFALGVSIVSLLIIIFIEVVIK